MNNIRLTLTCGNRTETVAEYTPDELANGRKKLAEHVAIILKEWSAKSPEAPTAALNG